MSPDHTLIILDPIRRTLVESLFPHRVIFLVLTLPAVDKVSRPSKSQTTSLMSPYDPCRRFSVFFDECYATLLDINSGAALSIKGHPSQVV
jgi:hypothetical protein